MKILHIGLVSSYTEGMTYQDNYLPNINIEQGHEVVFVTNTNKYVEGKLVEVEEEDVFLANGLRLIRYRYDNWGNRYVSKKIQKVTRVKKLMEGFKPDVIMYHGVCGYELMDVAEYVKRNPKVLFYVDSHEDFKNTARNFLSKFFYKYVHGVFVNKALPYINKILYLGEDCKVYLKELYNISDDKLEFYPLGGIIQSDEEQVISKEHLCEKYGLEKDSIIFMHSGKMNKDKKTINLLKAFKRIRNANTYLFIFGSIEPEVKEEIITLIEENSRVYYLGWKSAEEIIMLLNAADVYCQPGTPSATSQVALCCGCAEIVYPIASYKSMYENSVLYAKDDEELYNQMQIICDAEFLHKYQEKGYKKACEILDYKKLAQRYLRE